MKDLWTFEVTDDSGLMSIVDPDAYVSYLKEDFTLDEFKAHCLSEMPQHRMLIWGTGVESTWRVEVCLEQAAPPGFREAVGGICSSRGRLALINYEDLSMAAMYSDERLPLAHSPHILKVSAGKYKCRIVQLEDPNQHEENLDTTDFIIQLNKTQTPTTWTTLPWFP